MATPKPEQGDGQYIDVVLFVDGKREGNTWIIYNSPESFTFPEPTVLIALSGRISPEKMQALTEGLGAGGMMSNAYLRRFGISARFDAERNRLILSTSAKAPESPPSDAGASKTSPAPASQAPAQRESSPVMPSPAAVAPQPSSPDAATVPPAAGPSSQPTVEIQAMKPPEPPPQIQPPEPPIPASSPPPPAKPDAAEARPAAPDSIPDSTPLVQHVYSRTREEMFQDVFGRKAPPAPSRIEVTLIVDRQKKGVAWIHFSENRRQYRFTAEPVLAALHGLIQVETIRRLETRVTDAGLLAPADLAEAGLPVELRAEIFEMEIQIPSQQLGPRVHYLGGRPEDPWLLPTRAPDPYSGYLNFRAKERFKYLQNALNPNDTSGLSGLLNRNRNERARQPLVTEWDGALNVHGLVLESHAHYLEKNDHSDFSFLRRDTRLIYDLPRQAVRLSAGDLLFPMHGFQSMVRMGGLGMARDFSLQPHLLAYPTRDFEFFLENPAEVKVYVNDALIATLQLDRGTHDLKGFPFLTGESDVKIEIMDISGQKQEIAFNFIHEPELLARGRSAFSLNAGFPLLEESTFRWFDAHDSILSVAGRGYVVEDPFASLFYRLGLTEVLTAGAYLQSFLHRGLAGLEAMRAFPLGKVHLELASSYGLDTLQGAALRLGYTYRPKPKPKGLRYSWRNQVELRSEGFARPIDPSTNRAEGIKIQTSFQAPFSFASFSFNAGYTARRGMQDLYHVSMQANRNWIQRLSSRFSIRHDLNHQGLSNTIVSASLNYSLFTSRHGLMAGQRTESHRNDGLNASDNKRWDNYTDLRWDYNVSAPFPVNPTLSAGTNFGPQSNDYEGRVGLRENEGQAEIYVRRIEPAFQGGLPFHQNYVDLTLQTALVFAGGSFALSRPVNGGFVLFKGQHSHRQTDFIANPNQMGYDAKSRGRWPGVMPALTPYRLKTIRTEPINPPLGSPVGQSEFTLLPRYKSGYRLAIGTQAAATVLATLVDAEGKPVAYQALRLVSVDNPTHPPGQSFTNGAGKFIAPGLKPGVYDIRIGEGQFQPVRIRIGEKQQGLVQLGDLKAVK